MARLSAEEYLVCDECRSRLGVVAAVTDEQGVIVAERVFLMLPGWRIQGHVISEPPAARARRRSGQPPSVLPRRFGRPRGNRGPGFVAPLFPDFGRGSLTIVCSDCDLRHDVAANDLSVPGMHDLSLVET